MKFMLIVKANAESEAGVMPSNELLATMGAFNQEMVDAGVMKDGAGLMASSKGARIRISGEERTVIDGPFPGELIAGYWILEVASHDEAIDWAKRAPNPHPGHESELELRRLFEMSDF